MHDEFQMPQDREAEASVIAAILSEPELLAEVSSIAQPSDFYDEGLSQIFDAILKLRSEGRKIDFLGVKNAVKPELIGPLRECAGSVSTSALAVPHAQILKEKSLLRQLHDIGARVSEEAISGGDPFELIADSQRRLVELASVRHSSSVKATDALLNEFDSMLEDIASGKGAGIPSHLPELNRHIGGFRPGEVTLIAANTSIGKTNFMLSIVRRIAERHSAAIFSLEMRSQLITNRMLAQTAGLEPRNILSGRYTREDFSKVREAKEQFLKLKLTVDDHAATLTEIESKISQLKSREGIELCAVDYLNLIRSTARHDNREREIAFISQSLKRIARENEVSIIAIAALDKAGESGGSPKLGNIRESSMLIYDADAVLLLDRPGARGENTFSDLQPAENRARVHVRKSRNGITGSFEIAFLSSTDFVPIAEPEKKRGELLEGFEPKLVEQLPF